MRRTHRGSRTCGRKEAPEREAAHSSGQTTLLAAALFLGRCRGRGWRASGVRCEARRRSSDGHFPCASRSGFRERHRWRRCLARMRFIRAATMPGFSALVSGKHAQEGHGDQWRTQLSSKTRAKFHVVMTPQYMYTDMVHIVIHIQLNRLPNCV